MDTFVHDFTTAGTVLGSPLPSGAAGSSGDDGRLSADGTRMALTSDGNLAGSSPTPPARQLYVWDLTRFSTELVSRGGPVDVLGLLSGAGVFTRRGLKPGRRSVALSGRVGRKALAGGAYRLTVTAADAAGNRSKAVRLGFTVVLRPR